MEKITLPKLPELVIDSFFKAIEKGDIKLGEILASERELAETLEISRGSLREGLSVLEFLGVIRSKGNRKVVEKDYKSIRSVLKLIKITKKNNIIHDYAEFRRFIELENIRLACKKITEKDLDEMLSILNKLKQSKNNDDPSIDYDFHISIAKASKNAFLISITELLLNMTNDLRPNLIQYPGRKSYIIEECTNIYNAIKAKNAEVACKYMEEHLFFLEITLKAIDSLDE